MKIPRPLTIQKTAPADATRTTPLARLSQQSSCQFTRLNLPAAAARPQAQSSQEHRTAPHQHARDQHHNGTTTQDPVPPELDTTGTGRMERARVADTRYPRQLDLRVTSGVRHRRLHRARFSSRVLRPRRGILTTG